MGLFSKFLGDAADKIDLDKLAKTVADAAEKVAGAAEKAVGEVEKAVTDTVGSKPVETRREAPAAQPYVPAGPTASNGLSWGPVMPAEENQFNYGGPYTSYFESIFAAEFPEYRVEREARGPRSTVYTFWRGTERALVVELLSRKSSARKLRSDCGRAGVPYLRYYYDYEGWWNTRSYVVNRTRTALGG